LPINDLAARDKIDMSQWYKAAGDMMSVGGKAYGLPLWSHPSVVGLFYNQDILDKAGVKLPVDLTFDKLTEIAKQLTKRTSDGKAEQFGYNPGRGYYGHGQVILAYGGDMVSKDGKKMTYDEPAVKQALTWMYDMDHTHKVTPLPGEADTGQLTINGKLAMWADGVWGYWGASQWKFNWGAALTPKGPSGTHGSMLQTDANPISKRSKNVDPAWELHKFMSGKDAGMVLLDNDYVASSRPDIYNSPAAQGKKGLAPFAKALEEAAALPVPANYRLRELETSINQVMDNLWLGKMTVDQVTAEVNRAGQQVLDKAGGST
jgi:ABC-type glycerol-3-phosphate transport system substrate-binding protein